MNILFISFLLLVSTVVLVHTYKRKECLSKITEFEVDIRGQFMCGNKPYTHTDLFLYLYRSRTRSYDTLEQKKLDKDGRFHIIKSFNHTCRAEAKNPYLWIDNYCKRGKISSRKSNPSFEFDDCMVRRLNKEGKIEIDLGIIQLNDYYVNHKFAVKHIKRENGLYTFNYHNVEYTPKNGSEKQILSTRLNRGKYFSCSFVKDN